MNNDRIWHLDLTKVKWLWTNLQLENDLKYVLNFFLYLLQYFSICLFRNNVSANHMKMYFIPKYNSEIGGCLIVCLLI